MLLKSRVKEPIGFLTISNDMVSKHFSSLVATLKVTTTCKS